LYLRTEGVVVCRGAKIRFAAGQENATSKKEVDFPKNGEQIGKRRTTINGKREKQIIVYWMMLCTIPQKY
jgi:hypothetical protein